MRRLGKPICGLLVDPFPDRSYMPASFLPRNARCRISPPPRKRVRTTAKRTAINTSRKTWVRGFIRKVEEAIKSGNKAAALAALEAAEPEIMRGVHQGRAAQEHRLARKVSRLTKRVAKLSK